MSHRYFENRDCPYYPCHDTEHINCLFCFCPLYNLSHCGGDFVWLTREDGTKIKDCSHCSLPHRKDSYAYIMTRLAGETENK